MINREMAFDFNYIRMQYFFYNFDFVKLEPTIDGLTLFVS